MAGADRRHDRYVERVGHCTPHTAISAPGRRHRTDSSRPATRSRSTTPRPDSTVAIVNVGHGAVLQHDAGQRFLRPACACPRIARRHRDDDRQHVSSLVPRPPTSPPFAPQDLRAEWSAGRVTLTWNVSAGTPAVFEFHHRRRHGAVAQQSRFVRYRIAGPAPGHAAAAAGNLFRARSRAECVRIEPGLE